MKHIISLGAGVQSSTMLLLADRGEIEPMPDLAIFSDVGDEPQEVYDWLEWLKTEVKNIPIKIVSFDGKVLSEQVGKDRPSGKFKTMPIPAWITLQESERDIVDPDTGEVTGSIIQPERGGGILRRQCTTDYKIRPLIKQARKEVGIFGKRTPDEVLVTQWIGISMDEIQRMKESREKWIEHRWPLIEMRWSRLHCLEWFAREYGKTPPRSACTFCPFHDNTEWRHIRDNYPDKWQHAIEIDRKIRNIWASQDRPGEFFLHRDRVPLDEADLGQPDDQLDLFNIECEGMCGV